MNLNLELLKGKTGVPGEKPLGARERTTTNSNHIYNVYAVTRKQVTLVRGEYSHYYAILANVWPKFIS